MRGDKNDHLKVIIVCHLLKNITQINVMKCVLIHLYNGIFIV